MALTSQRPLSATSAAGGMFMTPPNSERIGSMTKLSLRQADAIPAINSNPADGASFPNYYLGDSGLSHLGTGPPALLVFVFLLATGPPSSAKRDSFQEYD